MTNSINSPKIYLDYFSLSQINKNKIVKKKEQQAPKANNVETNQARTPKPIVDKAFTMLKGSLKDLFSSFGYGDDKIDDLSQEIIKSARSAYEDKTAFYFKAETNSSTNAITATLNKFEYFGMMSARSVEFHVDPNTGVFTATLDSASSQILSTREISSSNFIKLPDNIDFDEMLNMHKTIIADMENMLKQTKENNELLKLLGINEDKINLEEFAKRTLDTIKSIFNHKEFEFDNKPFSLFVPNPNANIGSITPKGILAGSFSAFTPFEIPNNFIDIDA